MAFATHENPGKSQLMRWIRDHLDYPHKDYCLIWPFGRHKTGYGMMSLGQKKRTAPHRYICEVIHGPPPSPKHHAAHSCGRGTDGCVNPHHVSWKTNSENQLDRQHKGGPRNKLTPEQAIEIRNLKGLEHDYVTAKRFGVTEITVRQIQAGKMWRNPKRFRIFSDDEVRAIRDRAKNSSQPQIAREYGVRTNVIHCIVKRTTYAHVRDLPEPIAA